MKRTILKISLIVFCFGFCFVAARNLGSRIFPTREEKKILIDENEINPGDSLYKALTEKYSVKEAVMIGRELGKICNTRNINPGDKYMIYHSTYGEILKFIYCPSPMENYVVEKSSYGFKSFKHEPEITEKIAAVKGKIHGSLYQSMLNSGIDVKTIMSFTEIFQWQIDFFTEVMPEDKFMLVFKQYYINGDFAENGDIILAGYKGKRGNFTAIRYKNGDYPQYYDAKGKSFRKQFLRAPLNYSRISSRFTYKRMHPVLKYVRPHLGIDYAAPAGTPVSSIGSGKVIYKGWRGGYGRTVEIRHNSVYTSQYGHLRSYARSIKRGTYVRQGQVIGYVGSSGLSTGPHLDFRIKKYGKPVNFLNLDLPPAKSVSKKNMDEFKKEVEEARIYLKYLESDYFAGKTQLIDEFKNTEEYETIYQAKLQK
ncbi:MAG: peptidoglycan DD-metalloendopeptidase family protein [Elusimicrobiota bacterium]